MLFPTPSQLAWQRAHFGLFCHFGINTFHNREWSAGELDPTTFDPKRFDPRQWVSFAREVGANYLILTAKHHDGFCLWPTATTPYSVASSPFGRDVVGEVAQACREAGLPLGLYLSPWDRNCAVYHDPPAYDAFYCAQLTELCTRYGELFEIWLDGAGSEGRVYNWDAIMGVIDAHQPQAMVFNMGRPTIRWVGNEDGLADDPCDYVVSKLSVSAFTEEEDATDSIYCPPECDVAIRQNWFWQDDDLGTLKTQEHLLGIWYRSIGRGANLLLNLGPNRDGLLDEHDMSRVREVVGELRQRFAHPLDAKITPFAGGVQLDFGGEVEFDHLILREDYTRGQRVHGYRLVADGGREITSGVTIGEGKWHAFPRVAASRLRLEWTGETTGDAVLLGAAAFLTGHEALPQLGAPLDYANWADKSDGGHLNPHPPAPWRPAKTTL